VLDASETRVLGEVRASDPGALSLPPGSYRVKCRSTDGMLAATLNLASGRADLDELPFETAQEELVLARGPSEVARHSIGVWFGPRFDPELRSAVSVSYQRRRHGLGLGASVGAVATKQCTAQGELLAALPWWNADVVALEVGLLVGVESRFDARGSSLALGPLVQLSTPLSSALQLSLREEMTRTIPLDDSAAPTLPLTTRLGLSLDL
jgi:hypothetical protein